MLGQVDSLATQVDEIQKYVAELAAEVRSMAAPSQRQRFDAILQGIRTVPNVDRQQLDSARVLLDFSRIRIRNF